jgi:hypothetical protein
MGLLVFTPVGPAPVDEDLDVRVSPELPVQICVNVGTIPGHDEQIARHLPALQAARSGSKTRRL